MSSKRIHFITDSTCDIPPDMLPNSPITVVPNYVNFGGNSYPDDNVQLDREEFYQLLPTLRPFPTTAAMAPGDVDVGDLTLDTVQATNVRVQQIVRGRADGLQPLRLSSQTKDSIPVTSNQQPVTIHQQPPCPASLSSSPSRS